MYEAPINAFIIHTFGAPQVDYVVSMIQRYHMNNPPTHTHMFRDPPPVVNSLIWTLLDNKKTDNILQMIRLVGISILVGIHIMALLKKCVSLTNIITCLLYIL